MDACKTMFKEPTIPDEVLAYQEPVDINELVSDVTLAKLNDIFQSIMKKQVGVLFNLTSAAELCAKHTAFTIKS